MRLINCHAMERGGVRGGAGWGDEKPYPSYFFDITSNL